MAETNPGEAVIHSLNIALVDQYGRITGYFNSTDGESMDHLKSQIGSLLEQAKSQKPVS